MDEACQSGDHNQIRRAGAAQVRKAMSEKKKKKKNADAATRDAMVRFL
jgi:hypothetical protein